MILIDETKYACIECIRGHRSSMCKHSSRPLLQVRSKGRPNIRGNSNPDHRVAVFARELTKDEKESEQEESGNKCSNKSRPVIMLKVAHRKIVDFRSGRVVGPYVEDSRKRRLPLINDHSFVNTTTCCVGGRMEGGTGCKCKVNKSKNVDRSKILKSYLAKRMKPNVKWEFIDELKEVEIKDEASDDLATDRGENDVGRQGSERSEKHLKEVVKIPACSIPGTCLCGPDCICEGCTTHIGEQAMNNILSITNYNNDNFSHDLLSLIGASAYPPTSDGFPSIPVSQKTMANSVAGAHNEAYDNTAKDSDALRSVLATNPITAYATKLENSPNCLNELSSSESLVGSDSDEHCQCSDDCNCINCETHGIINGIKLDEIFTNTDVLEYKSLIQFLERDPTYAVNI